MHLTWEDIINSLERVREETKENAFSDMYLQSEVYKGAVDDTINQAYKTLGEIDNRLRRKVNPDYDV